MKIMKKFSKILISITCFTILFSFGAMIGTLSASIPELADTFDEPESKVGELFTARGLGYAIGAISTGALLNYNIINITSELFFCFIVIVFGTTIAFIAQSSSISIMMILVLFNAICMGYFDTFCCFWLGEIWGLEVGPWMQALFAVMGLGQVTGPTLVGFYGYKIAFTVIASTCVLPILGIVTKGLIGEIFEDTESNPNPNPNPNTIANKDGFESVSIDNKGIDSGIDSGIGNQLELVVYDNNEGVGGIDTLGVDADVELTIHNTNSNSINNTTPTSDTNINCACPITKPNTTNTTNNTSRSQSDSDSESESGLLSTPNTVKILLFFYYMFYLGMEIVYSGWVGSFALDADLTHSESKAAYLVSILYMASTISRISAVPLNIYISNRFILLISLCLASIGSLFIVLFAHQSYVMTAIGSVILGLGFGPIFSVGMTIPIDYGCCTLDSNTVAICIIGGAAGDAVLPVVVGLIMNIVGYMGLPYSVLSIMCMLWCICIAIHFLLTHQYTKYVNIQTKNDDINNDNDNNELVNENETENQGWNGNESNSTTDTVSVTQTQKDVQCETEV